MVVATGVDGGLALGHRYLGVGVGTPDFRREYVKAKVVKWVKTLRSLSQLAQVHPHEAYCLLTKSIIPSWRYIMRTMPVGSEMYQPLEDELTVHFFPAAFGWTPESQATRMRAALPRKFGGLAIPDPCRLARQERRNATWATCCLTAAILKQDWDFYIDKKELHEARLERQATEEMHFAPSYGGDALRG